MANWETLSPADKIRKVHVSIMRHKDFALISGVTAVGNVYVDKKSPTACTNGRDVWYGEDFLKMQNEKQARYLVLHENFHKALRHCTAYPALMKKYPEQYAQAIDFVVNDQIETVDPKFEFVERPTAIPPLVNPKFHGWSMERVLHFLIQQQQQQQQPQGGKGSGKGKGKGSGDPMDEHMPGEDELSAQELEEAKQQIEDAVRQGKLLQQKLAGNEAGGMNLDGAIAQRETNWRHHLREFVTTMVAGDDMSRFVPPNKRMLASGFLMPSHFSESTGELHVYCDTSGSMTGVYPIVFGEVARIVQDVHPEKVRVIWWDTAVAGEQVFEPKDYAQIGSLLQPAGGGGTTPEVVKRYVEEKEYKAKCAIWLSDGDFYSSDVVMPWPVIWGIVGNDNFVPQQGKVLHLPIE